MKNFKPKINFYLNTDARIKSVERRVMIYIRGFGGKTIKFSTDFLVNPKQWDLKNKTFKRNSQSYYTYGHLLNVYKAKIEKALFFDLPNLNPNYSFEEAKAFILNIFENKSSQQTKYFMDYFDEYIAECEPVQAKASITKIKTLKKHILAFEAYKYNKANSITFELIDNQFMRELNNFLIEKQQIANNTNARYLKAFKSFLFKCVDKGVAIDLAKINFKVNIQEVEHIALTNDELQKMIDLDLSENSRLDKVRDLFLFAVYTGQRFSDVSNIKATDVVDNIWRLQTQKTKTFNLIPLSKGAIELLNKYVNMGLPFPSISNQKCNEYLKEIGKIAKINTPITTTRYKGSQAIVNNYAKYELISTHTARRTFVTLSLQKGMRVDTLKSITGHKDHKSYEKYIKEDVRNKISELHNAWD